MSVSCGGRTAVKIGMSSGCVFGFFADSLRSRERDFGILEPFDLLDDADRLLVAAPLS